MATINYFNIYSLDFSHLRDMKQQIAFCQEPLASQLESAFEATEIKSQLAKDKISSNALEKVVEMSPENPGLPMFIQTLSNIQQTNRYRENLLEKFDGADPFAIQVLVHHILGIPQTIEPQSSDETRQQCFLLMKKSGFLQTDYSSVNTAEERPLLYQPHILASAYLEEHPEIQTLAIGCGEAGETYSASCHFRRAGDHADKLFSIDHSAMMGPTLVVDIHDPDFWKLIPNERFESVVDHTSGYFLFDDPKAEDTIQHLFRTLKHGGYLELDFSFEEKHIGLLESAGFTIDINNPKIAIKFLS